MRKFASLSAAMLLLCAYTVPTPEAVVTIDMAQPGAEISEGLYGIFIEDINEASDGCLYAEMLRNRSFEDGTLPFLSIAALKYGFEALEHFDIFSSVIVSCHKLPLPL